MTDMLRTLSCGFAGLAFLTAPLPALAAEQPASYATPQAAIDAFATALEQADQAKILVVFGTDARGLLSTNNADRDANNREAILTMYKAGYRFRPDDSGGVTLLLGADGWPFPIPLARGGDGWAFDIEEGRDEVLYRRIGLNELETIEIMSVYGDIQAAYRLEDHDSDGVMEFAPSILSSPGVRDGLVWNNADSPLGVRIAMASLDGYNDGTDDVEPEPFGGYYYRILHSQGASAPGGAIDYMIGGNMMVGHALLAVPSDYGQSGIHSFLVSENGTILEADLGKDSLDVGFAITSYDPGADWTPVEP